jgi:hypothetical protein
MMQDDVPNDPRSENLNEARPFVAAPERSRGLLLPLRTVEESPPSFDGADIHGEVTCEDNIRYVVKGVRGGAVVPACEWVAAEIAHLLGLDVPNSQIIELMDGSTVFGSQFIKGAAAATETAEILTSTTLGPAGNLAPGLQHFLSQIYAFDMAINNIDRHIDNYVAVRVEGGRRLFAVDQARSLFWSGTLDDFPSERQPTRTFGRQMRKRHGFDPKAATDLLDSYEELAPTAIIRIIEAMPDHWLSLGAKEAFVDWWKSDKRHTKIGKLRSGLTDGSLL